MSKHNRFWSKRRPGKSDQMPPRLTFTRPIPRKVPEGKFLWHNHVQHCVGMPHGWNGFRYRYGMLPVNYRKFERCQCGVTELPHYKVRGAGSGKCVTFYKVLRNAGRTAKQARNIIRDAEATNGAYFQD
ncbi:MAG: hypothetical protein WCB70_21105 [Xanthobacteraceae bacterium]